MSLKKYTIKPGDTLPKISSIFSVPVCMVIRANNNKTKFSVGDSIIIPDILYCSSGLNALECKEYNVKQGDTLYSISKKFCIPMKSIMDANSFSHPGDLKPETTISIPKISDNYLIYNVGMGETLDDISKKFVISKDLILSINNLHDDAYFGMQLILPKKE